MAVDGHRSPFAILYFCVLGVWFFWEKWPPMVTEVPWSYLILFSFLVFVLCCVEGPRMVVLDLGCLGCVRFCVWASVVNCVSVLGVEFAVHSCVGVDSLFVLPFAEFLILDVVEIWCCVLDCGFC